MQDLNDLYFFTQVVKHGSFAAAGRAIRLPKSKLSRRIAQLEDRLGVRLIERTSRRFRVTEIGMAFHDQALSAMRAAERAEAIVAASLSEPRGVVRFACPTGLLEIVAPMLPDFLTLYPRARVQIVAVDRPVDLIAERIDVALRVRVKLDTDAAMTMRTIGRSRRILLASPALANGMAGRDVDALAELPTLSTSDDGADVTWTLEGPGGETRDILHVPRLGCDSFATVRDAAIAGLGIALLPDHVCRAAMQSGELVQVLPQWQGQEGIVHLIFTTKVGLPPLVRAWIDHIAACFRDPGIFGV